MTVNAWFDFWFHEIKEKTTCPNTVRNYRERYEHNIISDAKPMHCQKVLNLMENNYKMGRYRFQKRIISVNRTMEFRYGDQEFRIGEPKSKAGYRIILMTQTAYEILKAKEKERHAIEVLDFRYKDFVFINRKGMPTKNSTYDSAIYKIVDKAGIERFSMHT